MTTSNRAPMAYHVTRHENSRITVELDGEVAYELERENAGRGIWALFPVHNGLRGAKITSDQYSNDLIEWVSSGRARGGPAARIAGGYVIEAPANASNFYISGTGYLCCRSPVRRVLTEIPVTELPIDVRRSPRAATLAEREAAGLNVGDTSRGAVFLEEAD